MMLKSSMTLSLSIEGPRDRTKSLLYRLSVSSKGWSGEINDMSFITWLISSLSYVFSSDILTPYLVLIIDFLSFSRRFGLMIWCLAFSIFESTSGSLTMLWQGPLAITRLSLWGLTAGVAWLSFICLILWTMIPRFETRGAPFVLSWTLALVLYKRDWKLFIGIPEVSFFGVWWNVLTPGF